MQWILSYLFLCAVYASCEEKQKITAALLLHGQQQGSKDSSHKRIHRYMGNFFRNIFKNNSNGIEFVTFPAVFSQACGEDRSLSFDKGHGSNMAHKEVWDQFYRNRRPCGLRNNDTLVVFEYDAFLGMDDAGALAIESVEKMASDIHFLGFCYQKPNLHPRVSGKAPYCLHAYAVTLEGARKLLDLVDSCSFFADAQVAILADSKNISWSYETSSYDKQFVNDFFYDNGIHLSGNFLYDGIFVQAKFDDELALQEGSIVNNRNRGKQLHIFQNKTWRSIPSIDVYRNIVGSTGRKVLVVSEWQFRKAGPEGPPCCT